jgi:hypothetical protein
MKRLWILTPLAAALVVTSALAPAATRTPKLPTTAKTITLTDKSWSCKSPQNGTTVNVHRPADAAHLDQPA